MPTGEIAPGAAAYDDCIERFGAQMADFGFDAAVAKQTQHDLDLELAKQHGFGDKTRFAQSMADTLETLWEQRERRGLANAQEREMVFAIGMSVFTDYPYVPLPHAIHTLIETRQKFHHIVVTKGEPEEQMRKLRETQVDCLVDEIRIVAKKDLTDWIAVLSDCNMRFSDTAHSWAIGNSLKADVNIPLSLGFNAIWIDGKNQWAFEKAEPLAPVAGRQFHTVTDIKDVLTYL